MRSHPSNAKRKQFDQQFKAVVRPELLAIGFEFDGKRVFRRALELGGWTAIQIVEFRLGIKNLVGRFTADVGVYASRYHPEDWPPVPGAPLTVSCLPSMSRRLGHFFDPPQSWLASVLGRPKPERSDYWWEQNADERKMVQGLQSALACLRGEALPWLDRLSCQPAFEWAANELAHARKSRESQKTSGAEPPSRMSYYTDLALPGAAPNGSTAVPQQPW